MQGGEGSPAEDPNGLVSIAKDLWVATRPLNLFVGEVGARMTVIRLADGGLFLHSPVRLDDATRAALDSLGPVRAVVAPSKVHHFFVDDYIAAYPQARAFCAPGLNEKRKDLAFHAVLGDEPEPEWRHQIEQCAFQGAPQLNEVVFFHVQSRTLVLTDLAFNVPHGKVEGARVFYWLVGAGGRFGPHRLIRLFIRDRQAAARSVKRILGWEFERVIVAHGEVLARNGRDCFSQAFAYLNG